MQEQTSSFSNLITKVTRAISNNDVASETPFLDATNPCGPLARFDNHETIIGNLLNGGRSTESHEIVAFNRDLRFKAASANEERARMSLAENASSKGRTHYSIKMIRTSLKKKSKVERAALGLTIEANYLSRLHHPNIIKMQGLCTSTVMLDNDCFEYFALITNRITETLAERIYYWNEQDSIALDSDFFLHLKTDYAFQIADALSYLHDRRIIFRNLDLDNIGFTANDAVQLMNFDCVKEIPSGESHLQDGFMGIQTYMALEMYQGSEYDFKVDSFAWSICFYEMLTQEAAFQTTTNEEALIREHGWCPKLEGCNYIPDGLLDLLEDAWEPDPNDRICMKEVKQKLEWILFGNDDDSNAAIDQTSCMDDTRRSSVEASGYGQFFNDESALGLDIDESTARHGQDEIYAAMGFSGTRRSFIPSELILCDPSERDNHDATATVEQLLPKIEYAKQYKGLKKNALPPLSMAPNTNKARRRCSNQMTPAPEMALCA